ncbi:MAG: hypothetical protein UY28_C0042G0003, partial [Candidatus Amesbacteria bacterium GW2011_GWB1_48_13]
MFTTAAPSVSDLKTMIPFDSLLTHFSLSKLIHMVSTGLSIYLLVPKGPKVPLVLVVNTDKSVYAPGETVKFQMASLDKVGHTLCDSKLSLEVKRSFWKRYRLPVVNSPTCGDDNVTNDPDYTATFNIPATGKYRFTLTNKSNRQKAAGEITVSKDSPVLDIKRSSATRINPFESNRYPMVVSITANEDWQGEYTDIIPDSYTFAWYGAAKVDKNRISWDLELNKGETVELKYEYTPEKISPALFYIVSSHETAPVWQIASDAIAITAETTGTDAGGNFTVTRPNTATGDFMVVITASEDDAPAVAPPTGQGWVSGQELFPTTDVDSQLSIFYKYVTNGATEPASYAFTGGANDNHVWWIGSLSGVAVNQPQDEPMSNNAVEVVDGTSHTAPAITTASAGAFVLAGWGRNIDADTIPPSSPWATRTDDLTDGNIALTVSSQTFSGAGSTGTVSITDVNGSADGGAGQWAFRPADTITGIAYTNDESTLDTSATICVAIDTGTTPVCDATDGTTGVFDITTAGAAAGEQMTFFFDGGTEFGNTVTVSDDGNIIAGDNLKVFQNTVIVRYETGTSINITQMDAYDSDQNDTDMLFNATDNTPDTIILENNIELHVQTNYTFAPGGNVTTQGTGDFHLDDSSTFTGAGSEAHVVGRSLLIDSSAGFTAPTSGTVSAQNTTIAGTLTAGGSTITLTGTTGTLFSRSGTFTPGTSTLVFNPNATVTLFSASTTVNNLSLTPTLADSGKTYTMGAAMTIDGDFTINPSGSAFLLTVNLGGTTTVASGKTTSISGSGSATSKLDTVDASDHTFSTGFLTIGTAGALDANDSSITVSGTTTTIFSNAGTFTADGSTVTISGSGALSFTAATSFNHLTISNNVSFSSNFSVKGNWTNSGTLTPGTSTVTFDGSGAQQISGNSAFYGLTISGAARTVTVTVGTTLSVADNGTLTLSGSTQYITLATSGAGWNLQVSTTGTTVTVHNISVSFSSATGYKQIDASDGSNFDGGNNPNWNFDVPATPTPTITPTPVPAVTTYWPMSEGNGTTVNDGTGNNNTGSIANAQWESADMCVADNCLYFDGSGDYVSSSDNSSFDMDTGESVTIELWFRHPDISTSRDLLVAKHDGTEAGYKIYMNADGTVTCGVDADSTWSPTDSTSSTAAYDDNLWHHLACVKNTTTSLKLYIDGRANGTEDTSVTASVANNDTFYLGIDGDGSSNGWAGFIDDFKIHRTARSADQIKADFNARGGLDGVSAQFGNNQKFLSDGLAGYWKLDEPSGNASDSSGLQNTALNRGGATYTTAKYYNGSEHVPASSQYMGLFQPAGSVQSVSFWANPDLATNYYLSLSSTASIQSSSGTITANGFTNPKVYVNGTPSTIISANTWQHITVTSDTPITAGVDYNYNTSSGTYGSIYCPTPDDCKIAYYDASGGDLKFVDCDNETCSSYTITTLDGAASGNSLTGAADKNTGQYTSLDCSAGAGDCKISYFDVSNGDLYFADCADATCSSGTTTRLDGGATNALTGAADKTTGWYTSLDCSAGAGDCKINYYDSSNGDLYFADCADATCSSGTTTRLDGGATNALTGAASKTTGYYTSLDCSAGAGDCKISYYDGTNGDLYFADCADATCSSGTATKLDGGSSGNALTGAADKQAGQYTSLDCSAGAGDCKISYYDGTNDDLYFADCADATCSSGTATKLDGGSSGNALTGAANKQTGQYTSLDCSAGAGDCKISYYDVTNTALSFADCANAACSSGTAAGPDGFDAAIGQYSSLSCPTPDDCKISYYDVSGGDLKFVDCDNETCSSYTITTLDGAASGNSLTGAADKQAGQYTSLDCSAGAGDCKISYYDVSNGDLYFAD